VLHHHLVRLAVRVLHLPHHTPKRCTVHLIGLKPHGHAPVDSLYFIPSHCYNQHLHRLSKH
jgi:hypothetical protein